MLGDQVVSIWKTGGQELLPSRATCIRLLGANHQSGYFILIGTFLHSLLVPAGSPAWDRSCIRFLKVHQSCMLESVVGSPPQSRGFSLAFTPLLNHPFSSHFSPFLSIICHGESLSTYPRKPCRVCPLAYVIQMYLYVVLCNSFAAAATPKPCLQQSD